MSPKKKKKKKSSRKKVRRKRAQVSTLARFQRRFRWLIKPLVFALGCGIGLLVPWLYFLDQTVTTAFEGRRWEVPSRVYARPLSLYPGQPMTWPFLQAELSALNYQSAAGGAPGSYSRSGASIQITTRGIPARQASAQYTLNLADGHVRSITDVRGATAGLVKLEPAEIASIYPLHKEDRQLVSLEEAPELLLTGLQAVEDRQFKHHHGVNFQSILRAAWANLRQGRVVQGGSTITQQLVKNYFLTSNQTLIRKLNEAMMAVILEARYDKAQILEAYLNEIWLGQQGARAIHGFARASDFYFGKPLNSLKEHELALLVALVKGASYYNPRRHPERALARRNQVLATFRETGILDQQTYTAARQRPLGVIAPTDRRTSAPAAFIDLVKRQLRADYREEDLRSEGLSIHTTLEPATQRLAEASVATELRVLGQRGLPEGLQAAMVVADVHSGEIRALVGDRDPARVGFNRALDARRQVGSVIKPLLYYLALNQPERFNLLTPIADEPVSLRLANGDVWEPRNYDGQSHGEVTLLTALTQSYNQAAVSVGSQMGVQSLVNSLRDLRLADRLEPVPALFLGALELSPFEVTQMYQAFAANGFRAPLRSVTSVTDAQGNSLKRYPLRLDPLPERDSIGLLTYAMTKVVEEGTASALPQLLGKDLVVAGKTGTTNERRDSWFVGYTQNHLATVWVGMDDNSAAGVTGSNAALRLWAGLFRTLPVDSLSVELSENAGWYWALPSSGALSAEGCPDAVRVPFLNDGLPAVRDACLMEKSKDENDKNWWRKWVGKDND